MTALQRRKDPGKTRKESHQLRINASVSILYARRHAPRMSPSAKWLAAFFVLLDCVGGVAVMPW